MQPVYADSTQVRVNQQANFLGEETQAQPRHRNRFAKLDSAVRNATSPSAAVGHKAGAKKTDNYIQDTFVKPMITEFSSLAAKKGDNFLLAGAKKVLRFNDQIGVEISKTINGVCQYGGPLGSLVGVVLGFLVRTGVMAAFTAVELGLAAVAVAVGIVTAPFWAAAAVVYYLDNKKMDLMIAEQKAMNMQIGEFQGALEESLKDYLNTEKTDGTVPSATSQKKAAQENIAFFNQMRTINPSAFDKVWAKIPQESQKGICNGTITLSDNQKNYFRKLFREECMQRLEASKVEQQNQTPQQKVSNENRAFLDPLYQNNQAAFDKVWNEFPDALKSSLLQGDYQLTKDDKAEFLSQLNAAIQQNQTPRQKISDENSAFLNPFHEAHKEAFDKVWNAFPDDLKRAIMQGYYQIKQNDKDEFLRQLNAAYLVPAN